MLYLHLFSFSSEIAKIFKVILNNLSKNLNVNETFKCKFYFCMAENVV